MIYPTVADIEEFFAKLPAEVQEGFAPPLESAQCRYRRVWQLEPLDEDKRIVVLCEFATTIFKTQTAKLLRTHSGSFDAFRTATSLEGGNAELGFWYAHRLYNLVERGRMLGTWHLKIEPHLWGRIREAENLWYNPDLVPNGWESYFGDVAPTVPADSVPILSTNADRKPPADFFEAYRAKNPTMTYAQIAGRMGIVYDTLFRIKEERVWVRRDSYEAAADFLGCRPEDLHPRNLPRSPRRRQKGHRPPTD